MKRTIAAEIVGRVAIDGAGVKLTRVLGAQTMHTFDPILMLDSFDSTNPEDYIKSFPMHPHRGIETISYVYKGKMTHKDSLGNSDTIQDGEVQWMTAGSGILHEEILPPCERMLGVQLWLNLPQKDKMSAPAYRSIKNTEIPELELESARLRLLAGEYEGTKGFCGKYLPLDYYDLWLEPHKTQILPTKSEYFAMLFLLQGDAYIDGKLVREKTAVRLTNGESISLASTDKFAQILYIASIPLQESIAWGGPIVMNTNEEVNRAFDELQSNTFLKEGIAY